jgi:hypothetical protein
MKNAPDYSPLLTALSTVAFISLHALSMTVPGLASPVTIVNPGFEADGTGFHNCSSVGNAVTGWNCTVNTTIGNYVDNPGTIYFTGGVPDGVSAAAIGIFGSHFNDDAFFQILSATVAVNTTYTLQMYVGHDNFASFDTPTITGGKRRCSGFGQFDQSCPEFVRSGHYRVQFRPLAGAAWTAAYDPYDWDQANLLRSVVRQGNARCLA